MAIQTEVSQNIRYWNSPDSGSDRRSISTDKNNDSESIFQGYQQSFDSSLFNLLGNKRATSNSFFGYDLNSSAQLRDASNKAKSMGMEKVLAAQLTSPLPFSDFSSDDKNKSYSGLNDIVNLTIQLEIAKARKAFSGVGQSQTMSLSEFINSFSDNKQE